MIYEVKILISFLICILFFSLYGRKFGLPLIQSAVISSLACEVLTVVGEVFYNFNIHDEYLYRFNKYTLAMIISGLLVAVTQTCILKFNLLHSFDFFAPLPLLIYSIGHTGCYFEGCCHSFKFSENSIINKLFPFFIKDGIFFQQLLECIFTFILFLIIVLKIARSLL